MDDGVPDDAGDSIAVFVEEWRRERPDLDPWPLAILGRAERISALLQRRAEQWLKPLGLTWETFCLIMALRRSGPPFALKPTDFYRESLLSSGTITNRIDRAATLGWVTRQPDPEDGRGTLVVLTPAGRALADQAVERHFGSLAQALSGLDQADRTHLIDLLAKALAVLEG